MNLTDTFASTPVSTLKNLVHILHDGQIGFRKASEHVTNPNLKELFCELSIQRSQFAGELQTELLSLGEKNPEKEGSTLAGSLHRAWIDIKDAVVGGDAHAVLVEAERGEDIAENAYIEALELEDMPMSIRRVLVIQQAYVQAAHNKIKLLRDASSPSSI